MKVPPTCPSAGGRRTLRAGFYGPVTTNAVKKWQHKHGLPASGGWQGSLSMLNIFTSPLLYWYRTSTFFFLSSVTESRPKTSRGTHQNILRTFSGLVVDRTQRGYQSREMYLRVKAVERRKLLASPEAPVRPEFGFEAGTSGLAPPAPAAGTSTAVGYPTTPPSAAHPPAAMTRSSRGVSAVDVITAAFWVGMGAAVMAGVGRVVTW